MTALPSQIDCLIVGAGPAGMTAAVYLARFRRSVTVVDSGESRAARIPLSHNIPGVSEGVSGPDLLARHREQAAVYGIEPREGIVEVIERLPDGDGFIVTIRDLGGTSAHIAARTVLLATGVRDRDPALSDPTRAIRDGDLRHCPVCDAFEAIDQNIAIIGQARSAVSEAEFLRTYSARLTLVMLDGASCLNEADRRTLDMLEVAVINEPVSRLSVDEGQFVVQTAMGALHRFDTAYSALGTEARSSLTQALGADHDEACRSVVVDEHQRTTVPGVWAAGDVVSSLNQVSVAWGQSAVAATDIHNHLRQLANIETAQSTRCYALKFETPRSGAENRSNGARRSRIAGSITQGGASVARPSGDCLNLRENQQRHLPPSLRVLHTVGLDSAAYTFICFTTANAPGCSSRRFRRHPPKIML